MRLNLLRGMFNRAKDDDVVQSTAPGYDRMAALWRLINALKSGTEGMRDQAGAQHGNQDPNEFLPRQPKEPLDEYRRRVAMSYLHPGFTGAVNRISSKAFAEKVVVQNQESLSPRLQEMLTNTDGRGKTIHSLGRELVQDGWERGLFHLGVDMPRKVSAPTSRSGPTRLDELNMMPRMLRIEPDRLFNWPHTIDEEGHVHLQSVRFSEVGTVLRGSYVMKEVQRIRVWNSNGTWELHEQVEGAKRQDEFRMISSGTFSYGEGIPLVTGYFNQVGFMEAVSPFMHVAWLNLAHWQSSSRQRYLLEFARLPFLFGSGWSKREREQGVTVSANKANLTESKEAKLSVIEHEGAAIQAGQKDLDDLERRMDTEGLRPMETKGGAPTAAARWLSEAGVQSDAQSNVREVEDRLTDGIRMAGVWIGEKVPEDVRVKIPADMLIRRAAEDMPTILEAHSQGALDAEEVLIEMKERGILRESADVQAILKRIEEQGPDEETMRALANAMPEPASPVPNDAAAAASA